MSTNFKALLASDNIPIICQPNNAANKMPKFNWAPRLGFAYRVRPNSGGTRGRRRFLRRIRLERLRQHAGHQLPVPRLGSAGSTYSYRPQLRRQQHHHQRLATMESTFGIIDMTNALNAYQPVGSCSLRQAYNYQIPYRKPSTSQCSGSSPSHDSVEVRYMGVLGKQLESLDPYHNAPRQALPSSVSRINAVYRDATRGQPLL